MASPGKAASPAERRWNDQWWDYVKNGTELAAEKKAAVAEQKRRAQQKKKNSRVSG